MLCLCFKSVLVGFHFYLLDVAGIWHIHSPPREKKWEKPISDFSNIRHFTYSWKAWLGVVVCRGAEGAICPALVQGAFLYLGVPQWWGPEWFWYQYLHSWYASFNFRSLHVSLQCSLKDFMLQQNSDHWSCLYLCSLNMSNHLWFAIKVL